MHRARVAPPRIEIAGATYHVNGKAVHGVKLFADESDRFLFLRLLAEQAVKSEWCVLAYSLMTTHYHLLLRIEKPTLSSGFQRFNSLYARVYNRRHNRRGALWQRRFFDSVVATDAHFFESIRYVALNAPRAGACDRPEDWPWCNYGSAIGRTPPDQLANDRELLRLFGTRRDVAMRRLREYVEEADPRRRRGQTPV
jgi:putative transposase